MVLIRPGQRDDEPARHFVGYAVHVVYLRGQQQLADIGKHRLGHPGAAGILYTINRGSDATGKETLNQFDEFGHAVTQVRHVIHIETVSFSHQ